MEFVELGQDEFYAAVALWAARDPMPYPEHPERTTWYTQRAGREVFGKTEPGWKRPCQPRRWYVAKTFMDATS